MMRTIVLNKSYRNTVEIATYAGAINQTTDLELLDRHGKAVEEVYFLRRKRVCSKPLEKI